ncbi:hypothetical protein HU200_029701 [Digitaria exilis]|uniref:Uncharacterized protein n=1 Tax=Digitaria exilis TaxID=1010633 RepID=A0A835BTJ9_9POAL|nr:hypothetical protein HU200_029701 [Digitaria exilis]CAB3497966.1 unnamed protein product [Digitaria exilis]
MANLTVLVIIFLVMMTQATMLPVHGARALERVELVAVAEASSPAKPPSSTSLRVPALIPFDGSFGEEEAYGPSAAEYLAPDCTYKTPVFGP